MAISEHDLEDIFSYHAPGAAEVAHYNAIRQAALALARTVMEHTPASADQTAAIRKIREATMTANAAVALKGKV